MERTIDIMCDQAPRGGGPAGMSVRASVTSTVTVIPTRLGATPFRRPHLE